MPNQTEKVLKNSIRMMSDVTDENKIKAFDHFQSQIISDIAINQSINQI